MNTNHFFDVRSRAGTGHRFGNAGYVHPAEETEGQQFERVLFGDHEEEDSMSGGLMTATQATRAREPVGSDSETLTPVTIRQVHHALALGNEPVKINNKVAKHITLVAHVTSLEALITRTSLLLDDCTGRIEAVYLTSPNEDVSPNNYSLQKRTRISEGLWIRVIGILCLMDGETKVSIIRMRPVEDSNEVVFHRLDAIKTFLEHTKKQQTRSTNVK